MGPGGSQVSFFSLNTLHVCWEQGGSAKACRWSLPNRTVPSPKPWHCDREAWKYLAVLGIEKQFNRGTRKAYNTIIYWWIHVFPTLSCTLSHSFVLSSRRWLTEVYHVENGDFDKQTASAGVLHLPWGVPSFCSSQMIHWSGPSGVLATWISKLIILWWKIIVNAEVDLLFQKSSVALLLVRDHSYFTGFAVIRAAF